MKKYLLFYGSRYYSIGGWQDFKGSFTTVAEAYHAWLSSLEEWESGELGRFNWFNIADSDSGEIVKEI